MVFLEAQKAAAEEMQTNHRLFGIDETGFTTDDSILYDEKRKLPQGLKDQLAESISPERIVYYLTVPSLTFAR